MWFTTAKREITRSWLCRERIILATAFVPVHAFETVPHVPSELHRRFGLPVYVSSQEVTVTLTGAFDVAVIGQDA